MNDVERAIAQYKQQKQEKLLAEAREKAAKELVSLFIRSGKRGTLSIKVSFDRRTMYALKGFLGRRYKDLVNTGQTIMTPVLKELLPEQWRQAQIELRARLHKKGSDEFEGVETDPEFIWMAVSPDEFEIPLCVADSQGELAEKLRALGFSRASKEGISKRFAGITANDLKAGGRPEYFIRRIPLDDEDEEESG